MLQELAQSIFLKVNVTQDKDHQKMDKLKQLFNQLRQQLHAWHKQTKEQTVENNNNQASAMYTEEQLMARLKFFIGICLSLTLFGIVFVVLYSLIFVTQPLNAISPIDQKFFELIVPIATFLTGTLSGIMLAGGDKDAQAAALKAANAGWERPPTPIAPAPAPAPSAPSSFSGAPLGGNSMSVAPSFGAPAPASSFTPSFVAPVAMTAGGKAIVPEFPQPEL
jgi:hypothetical protein